MEAYNHLGLVSYQLQKYPEALYHYRQCRHMLENLHGTDHPILAMTIQNIGKARKGLQHYDVAMQEFQTAPAMLKKSFPADHPDLARSLSHMGELARLQGQPKTSLEIASIGG